MKLQFRAALASWIFPAHLPLKHYKSVQLNELPETVSFEFHTDIQPSSW